ncbi:flocculation protein FLO11 isoform X1 [Drosophila mojavensis]|uniref:MADF domain-containing protein n=2 Tax=Drosophila mojavensis TaxID=7230 RepID=B4KR31_DROMO|nr:flocculation protein FLO11 isoform X1 [Drosophila mojavensis]EDW10387.1 uncharacterized protein Dmoj_GI18561 [Drosophila mojavensis]
MKEMKVARAISESSTTSDNTSDFIDIVKKYDVVYNNHNPDYKNVEVKMKVWTQIADEIGLSVEASKRKWKNLRDSYTKYLRSFRVGTKTSKKYQYWAHADHMEFLKPFQGPGRNSANGNGKSNDEDDNECDFGYQVLAKAASNGGEDDLKITIATATASTSALSTQTVNSYTTPILTPSVAATPPSLVSPGALSNSGAAPQNHNSNSNGSSNCAAVAPLTLSSMTPPAANCSNSSSNSGILPLPALPLSAAGKSSVSANAAALATLASLPMGIGGLPAAAAAQMFTLKAAAAAAGLPLTSTANCSTANNVGCLIIEPHLFAAADNFKKELSAAAAAGAPLGLFQNLANRHNLNGNATTAALGLGNPTPPPPPPAAPPSSKVRRVQPSPQTAAINLSCTSSNTSATSANCSQPSPAKTRKISDPRFPSDWDVSAVLQANRELDANTLFFLSLARQVRAMPMKFQSLAKMRCMRIVSDIELELENFDCNGVVPPEESGSTANLKYCTDTPPPQQPDGSTLNVPAGGGMVPEGSTEHFVYVMSPSRVESMIDISSDEESNMNGGLPPAAAGAGLSAAVATGAVH